MTLPDWPGAEVVYKRAYDVLEAIAVKHALGNTGPKTHEEWKKYNDKKGWPPDDVRRLIRALNQGDEEFLKGAIAQYNELGYLP